MKKIAIAIIIYFFSANLIYSQSDRGVHFVQGLSWEQVKEKAKNENKYIFVDCYVSWCGSCKAMDKNVYPVEKVGDYINEYFIPLKAQLDTSKLDDDQVKQFYADAHFLMQEYKINAFPSLLFFSPDGAIVHKGVGFIDEQELISLSKDAMDPGKQYYTLIEKYSEGTLDSSYMKDLARIAKSLNDKELAEKIANAYIDRLDEKQLFEGRNIWFMVDFTTATKERGFTVFRDHTDRIHQADSTISIAAAKGFIQNIIYQEEMKPYLSSKNGKPDWAKMKMNLKKYGDLGEETFNSHKAGILFETEIEPALKIDPDWNKALALIKKQHAGKGEEFLVGSSIVYYLNNGLGSNNTLDHKNFIGAATLYLKKYYSYLGAYALNDWAWSLFEKSMDKNELNTALIWSDSCMKLSPKPDATYIDTYANLLYKIGRIQEAIAWEEKAVSMALPRDKEIHDNFLKMKKGVPTWKNN